MSQFEWADGWFGWFVSVTRLNIFPTDLCWVKLKTSPDDLDQFAHGDVVGDQELGLVKDW